LTHDLRATTPASTDPFATQAGDLVSHYFAERVPSRLPSNPRWASEPGAAMAEELDKLERQLLSGALVGGAARWCGPLLTSSAPRREPLDNSHRGSFAASRFTPPAVTLAHSAPPPPFADPSIDTEFSGTTAVLGTVRKRTLTVANIGDSRCIVGRATAAGASASAATQVFRRRRGLLLTYP
jgi:hypothetical protein